MVVGRLLVLLAVLARLLLAVLAAAANLLNNCLKHILYQIILTNSVPYIFQVYDYTKGGIQKIKIEI